MREPFTLEQLHLFNFPYFLYFSRARLFSSYPPNTLTDHLPERSAAQISSGKSLTRVVPTCGWRVSGCPALAAGEFCSRFSCPASPPIALVQPSPPRGRAGLANVLCPMCTARTLPHYIARRARRPAHKPVARRTHTQVEGAEVVVAVPVESHQ